MKNVMITSYIARGIASVGLCAMIAIGIFATSDGSIGWCFLGLIPIWSGQRRKDK
jgi:hypothetical protein